MTAIIITKNEQGRLEGIDEKGSRAYAKWRKLVAELEPGQTMSFAYRMPRSPAHHKLFFKKLQTLLERTEAFDDLDKLRYWLTMGAGYCDFVPGIDGQPNAIPKSLDFTQMDETEFSELHRQVDNFLWTSRAQAILWPHLDEFARYKSVEDFLRGFE